MPTLPKRTAARVLDALLNAFRRLYSVFRNDRYAQFVLLAATLATVAYQATATFWWGGSDHLDNLRIAWQLIHREGGADIPSRTSGMGIFLVLTGVAPFDTWYGLIATYALMSLLIPVLVYFTLSWKSRGMGALAALLILLSAIPYEYSKSGAPEELFHFLHFLALFLIARYFRFRTPGLTAGVTACLLALCLVRPVAALYFWVFCAIGIAVLLIKKESLKPLALAAAVYAACMVTWALVERDSGSAFFSPFLSFQNPEEKRLAEAYFNGPVHGFETPRAAYAIDPERSADTRELHEALRNHIARSAGEWRAHPSQDRPRQLFGDIATDPDAMTVMVLSTPIYCYFDLIRESAYAELGRSEGPRIMRRVANDYGTWGFMGAVRYLARNPMRILIGGSPPMGNRNFFGLFLMPRLRYYMQRSYSLSSGAIFENTPIRQAYESNPTPQTLEALVSGNPDLSKDLIAPENGPATRELMGGMRLFIEAFRWNWQDQNIWISQFRDRPEDLYATIFKPPIPVETGIYEGFMYDSLARLFGYERLNRLYGQAAKETLRRYPLSAAMIWDNFLRIALVRTFGDIKSQLDPLPYSYWANVVYVPRHNDSEELTPGLAKGLAATVPINPYAQIFSKAYAVFHLLSFIFVITALSLLLIALASETWPLTIFLAFAYLYNAAVIAVYGNFGDPRYYDVFVFLPVLITLVGLHESWGFLLRRASKP